MTHKVKSAEIIHKYIHLFRCPLCHSPMNVVGFKSIICIQNHTFDLAKQGYVNMANRSTNNQYDKQLFKARQAIIRHSDLYAQLHEKMSEIIVEKMGGSKDEAIIFDAGCGEGSHLHKILDHCEYGTFQGIGLDLSKEGIQMAAKHYSQGIWLVGDLANAPLANDSCNVILNIFSPANYKEFKRVLAPDGFVIKVVPRVHYLKELREVLFDRTDKRFYKNDVTVSLFAEHFQLDDVHHLSHCTELTQPELNNLVHMSPLTWNASPKQIELFMDQRISQITIDLDILVGTTRPTKGDRS